MGDLPLKNPDAARQLLYVQTAKEKKYRLEFLWESKDFLHIVAIPPASLVSFLIIRFVVLDLEIEQITRTVVWESASTPFVSHTASLKLR